MLELIAPTAAFAVAATFTPGGATALATASGARFGLRRSVPLIFGIATGMATLAAAASIGLAGLLLAAPVLQHALKLAGTLYLLWLATRIARSGSPNPSEARSPTAFLGGILLLWLNPKAWATTLSAAASFAMFASGPVELALVLSVTFAVTATVSLTLWASGGVLLGRLLRTERQWTLVNLGLALLLVASIVPIWLGN